MKKVETITTYKLTTQFNNNLLLQVSEVDGKFNYAILGKEKSMELGAYFYTQEKFTEFVNNIQNLILI